MFLKASIMHTRSQNRFGAFSCQQSDNDVDGYTKKSQITFRTVCFGLITDERRLAHLILYTPLPPPPGLRSVVKPCVIVETKSAVAKRRERE